MGRRSILQQLSPLMATQWGLVTTAQAQQLGIARSSLYRLETTGKLERLLNGVYRNTSVPSEQFEALHAAWLSLYPAQTAEERLQHQTPDAVVSSHTATYLLGVSDFVPEPYCFSTPTRKQTQRTDIVIKLKSYPAQSITRREGLPITTFEQTVADLVAENVDLSLISNMFLSCSIEMYSNIDFPYLEQLLAPYAKRNGFASNDGKKLLRELTAPMNDSSQRIIQTFQNLIFETTTPNSKDYKNL